MSEYQRVRREVLLVEYQKTQDSAEHHDSLVGSVTALWLGSAVLIGFVLSALGEKHAHHYKAVMILLIALGICLTIMTAWWALRAGKIKRKKYARCKEIERELGMRQHLMISPQQVFQTVAYVLLMALFLAAWAVLLARVAAL